jgi:hypothetical protein
VRDAGPRIATTHGRNSWLRAGGARLSVSYVIGRQPDHLSRPGRAQRGPGSPHPSACRPGRRQPVRGRRTDVGLNPWRFRAAHSGMTKTPGLPPPKKFSGASLQTPRGKGVRTQGVIVLATRKPQSSSRYKA